jgi:hypothetical protein
MKYKQSFIVGAMMALCLMGNGLLTGCAPSSPGGPSRGERKKMFTFDQADVRWEGNGLAGSGSRGFGAGGSGGTAVPGGAAWPGGAAVPPLPFALGDTLLQKDGGSQLYALLHLPSADYDFLLMGAKIYEPYLPGWLKAWSQTGREGLVIDLSAGKATARTSFQLSGPGLEKPIPLVLCWDAASEVRAGFYTQLLEGLTAIQCSTASSEASH